MVSAAHLQAVREALVIPTDRPCTFGHKQCDISTSTDVSTIVLHNGNRASLVILALSLLLAPQRSTLQAGL